MQAAFSLGQKLLVNEIVVVLAVANCSRLWETVRMSEKRTKADKAQRQADQLEKKASRRPAQTRKTFLDPAQVENAIVCPRLRFLAAVTDGKEQQVSRRIGQDEVLSSLSGSRSQSGTKEHR